MGKRVSSPACLHDGLPTSLLAYLPCTLPWHTLKTEDTRKQHSVMLLTTRYIVLSMWKFTAYPCGVRQSAAMVEKASILVPRDTCPASAYSTKTGSGSWPSTAHYTGDTGYGTRLS